jgi:hypothetical protein
MTTHNDRYPVVTYTNDRTGQTLPGGQCRCCGAGPNPDDDFHIRRAGLCDTDGVFYSGHGRQNGQIGPQEPN